MTYLELAREFYQHNEEYNIKQQYSDDNALVGVIVFTEDSFDKVYTEEERSYKVRSDNKAFLKDQLGSSMFGNCLDGKDLGVRLDWYMPKWKIEKCYLL